LQLVLCTLNKQRLTMPKMIISAGGDEFQMPDDQTHWADKMQGETHYLGISIFTFPC
jgi:PhoPQ-activated pathogenicity-related protein